jgi:hypothetical protein
MLARRLDDWRERQSAAVPEVPDDAVERAEP